MTTVLVVDDKDMMRDSVAETLRRAGFGVIAAGDGPSAIDAIAKKRPDAVVTDLKMPGMTGVELLERVRAIDADLPVILMTAYGTVDTAVEAMRLGAFDYVTKPFEGDELLIAIKRGVKQAKLSRENAALKAAAVGGVGDGQEPVGPVGLDRIIGGSPAMAGVKEQVEAVAASQGTVLITGESGTGKEVIARAIHDMSPRADAPFLAVNCAALSEGLLESELFGHERGAFTGAERLRKGRFELAHGGTLLLDEVSEVSPQIQAKLLRALQERAFERVGSSVTIGVDVRVIATSNRDLPAEAAEGSFRSDLFFRLNVLPVHLPPLRERGADIAELVRHFVAIISEREGIPTVSIAEDAMDLLGAYAWPGNVRELQNICERAVVIAAATGNAVITGDQVRPWLGATAVLSAASAPVLAAAVPSEPYSIGNAGLGETRISGGGLAGSVVNARGLNGNGHLSRIDPVRHDERAGTRVGGSLGGQIAGHVPGHLAGRIAEAKPVTVFDDEGVRPLADIEREAIVVTLRHFSGHRQKTARALGIGVRTLGLKLKKWKEERLVPESL
ncbi:MAG: sigma-54 dependent transcriptional regulator [Planctomycetota bacterium]